MDVMRNRPVSRREMLRGGAALATTAGMASLLAACGGTSSGGGRASAHLTNIESDDTPIINQAYRNMYAAFRKEYPDVSITFDIIPWAQVNSKMLTLAQANALPDCGRMSNPAGYAAAGMVLPLEHMVTKADLNRFSAEDLQQYTAKGSDGKAHLYGLPWFSGAGAMFINKTLFERAGVPVPSSTKGWTTDEFTRICKELSHPPKQWGVTIDVAGIGDPVQNFLLACYAYGGRWVAGDPNSTTPEPLTFDRPETVDGITWYADLYRKGYAVPSAPTDDYQARDANFASGKAAIEWQGPWTITQVRDEFKKAGYELASMSTPKGPAGNPTWYGGGGMGIYVAARQHGVVSEALDWIRFVSSDRGEKVYCKTDGMIPASLAARQDPYWSSDPIYQGYLEAMKNAPNMFPLWAPTLSTLLDTIVPPLLQGVFTSRITPSQMASEVQQQVVAGLAQANVKVPKS